jgi:hypothetical protein
MGGDEKSLDNFQTLTQGCTIDFPNTQNIRLPLLASGLAAKQRNGREGNIGARRKIQKEKGES